MIKFIALGAIIQDNRFIVEYCICVKELKYLDYLYILHPDTM